jgi:hypothetical protein
MSNIIKPDQHLATYIYEKQTNPDAQIVLRQYQREVVEMVDSIVELAHGERDFVKSENDWKVFEELLIFWMKQWPEEYIEFKDAIKDIRETRGTGGYSKSKEIKYVGALPSQRFMKMVKAIFPAQQWDKKFTQKFVNRFPLFKVGGA